MQPELELLLRGVRAMSCAGSRVVATFLGESMGQVGRFFGRFGCYLLPLCRFAYRCVGLLTAGVGWWVELVKC